MCKTAALRYWACREGNKQGEPYDQLGLLSQSSHRQHGLQQSQHTPCIERWARSVSRITLAPISKTEGIPEKAAMSSMFSFGLIENIFKRLHFVLPLWADYT